MVRNVAIYLAIGSVDLRGAFDQLAAITRTVLRQDPMSGALFLFVNKRNNRIKCLWWDDNGFVILYKRLNRGTFDLPCKPNANSCHVEISRETFTKILSGLPLEAPTRTLH